MANDSENRRTRGRPPVYLDADYKKADADGLSARSGQNRILALKAIRALSASGVDFRYLMERTTVLAELGRLRDPRSIPALAQEICDGRMTSRRAIALIHRVRGLREPEPDSVALGKAIKRCVQDYRERHPALSREDIDSAIRFALIPD